MQVIGTAGHVDHGKSTLVRRLTGIDPDRFAEEKRRGLTIDLGFAWLRLPSGREVGVVDVPGHERFVRNMLAGAGGITVCLFVVAANEGWMPQSAEHLAILDVLGVSSGVVALTKTDAVDEETLALAVAEVEERLAGTTLAGSAIVACSGTTGNGLPELVGALDAAVAAAAPPPDEGNPRLWVDRVFTIAGAGTVVTGTLMRGGLDSGAEVEIAPEGRRARIRAIQTHKKELAHAAAGNRVALNLAGLERQGAERGDAVVAPGRWRATRVVDVTLRVLPAAVTGSDVPVTEKGAHLLYVGSAETPVRLKLLGTSKVRPGERGFAELHLAHPLPLVRGDRFVIRDAGRVLTLGGGEVLDPLPAEARRSDPERPRLLAELEGAAGTGALHALVRAAGGLDAEDALFRSGARRLGDGVVRLGSWLVTTARRDELEAMVLAAVEEHHRARPLERGIPRAALKQAVALRTDAFDALLDGMDAVAQEGALVRLASHRVAFAPEQERARATLLEEIESAGFTPPLAKELTAERSLLRALVENGDIVAVGDFYLTRSQAEDAKQKVTAAISESEGMTVAEIRDLLGTTRKYAVPLCEWLDASGITRRRGDLRVLGPRAREG
ncbi:MAG TPA: selenocysteine-specific translation elongation factor [Actinomycetota bacterium]|nr:selenocysteine-specific translation elongation factor [Actinomycetota bacterium]